jgi:hypothetical protein
VNVLVGVERGPKSQGQGSDGVTPSPKKIPDGEEEPLAADSSSNYGAVSQGVPPGKRLCRAAKSAGRTRRKSRQDNQLMRIVPFKSVPVKLSIRPMLSKSESFRPPGRAAGQFRPFLLPFGMLGNHL